MIYTNKQAVASLSIFFSFIAIQNRINQSNKLLANITDIKKELKITKNLILGTSNNQDFIVKRDLLEKQIIDTEKEWMNAITFIEIPNIITLRFRVPQSDSQITSLQEKENNEMDYENTEKNVDNNLDRNNDNNSNQQIIDKNKRNNIPSKNVQNSQNNNLSNPFLSSTTPTQKLLLFVGSIVIASLFSLLNLLNQDPVTSTSFPTPTSSSTLYKIPSDIK